ncbi:MAG: threonine ammonia-lyase [Longimicrobiales bacterium]
MLTPDAITAARDRIKGGVVETGSSRMYSLSAVVPGSVYMKAEFRQRTGSFKDRGALNKLLLLPEESRSQGVVAASAGNHAQALAFHASRLGIPCTIVMPETAPLIKVSNTKGYGARVFQVGETLSDGMSEVERLVDDEGLVLVHAFNDEDVMAGQGTMGLEILAQVPDVTKIVVPIGGGGMISGIATAVKDVRPDVRVIGVEAAASPTAYESLKAGGPVHIVSSETLADGIAVKQIGGQTFPIIQSLVDDVVLVNERQIAETIFFLLEKEKVVIEGAGAVGAAAVLSGVIPTAEDDVVVCVLCGGNIDVNIISRIIDGGLWRDGRLVQLRVTGRDRPGYLNELTQVVAAQGANVLDIEHRRAFGDISVGDVEIAIRAETRGREHVAEIVGRLRDLGHEADQGP